MSTQSGSKGHDGIKNAITLLVNDHKNVQKMFKEYEKLAREEDAEGKSELARNICAELTVHARIEEEIFYPAARAAFDDDGLLDEAQVEHATAKDLIEQIESMRTGNDLLDATVTVLGEYVNHHIKEEQNELFPKVKKADMDLQALGRELSQRKAELLTEMGMDELIPSGKSITGRSSGKKGSRGSTHSRHH